MVGGRTEVELLKDPAGGAADAPRAGAEAGPAARHHLPVRARGLGRNERSADFIGTRLADRNTVTSVFESANRVPTRGGIDWRGPDQVVSLQGATYRRTTLSPTGWVRRGSRLRAIGGSRRGPTGDPGRRRRGRGGGRVRHGVSLCRGTRPHARCAPTARSAALRPSAVCLARRGDVGPVLPLLPAVGSVRRSDPPGDDGVPGLPGLPAPGEGGTGSPSARSAWQAPASSAAAAGERARLGAGSTVGGLRVVRCHLLGYAGDHQLWRCHDGLVGGPGRVSTGWCDAHRLGP